MKRFSMMMTALACIVILLSACADSTPGTPMKVRVATDPTFPPFEKVYATIKDVAGFDIDVMKAIAERANLQIEFGTVYFTNIPAAMEQCQYDAAISAITITPALKQKMNFSNPYFLSGQVVVVKKSNESLTGKDKLSGKLVGTQANSNSEAEVKKISGATLKTYRTYELAFKDLIGGMVDAVISDKALALTYTRVNANNLKIVGDEFAVEEFGIAVCSKNADLLQRINDGLAKIKANGTLDKLNKQWIIEGVQPTP